MEPLRHLARRPAEPDAARAVRGGRAAALACALLVRFAAPEAAAQPGGLFGGATRRGRRRPRPLDRFPFHHLAGGASSAIDFEQLTPPADTAATVPGGPQAAQSGVLTLNLFDDASFSRPR